MSNAKSVAAGSRTWQLEKRWQTSGRHKGTDSTASVNGDTYEIASYFRWWL